MEEIAIAVGRFVFWIVVEVLITLTGEIILWIFTLGKHKLRFDLNSRRSVVRSALLWEGSFWVGLVFWLIVIVLIAWGIR